MFKNTFMLDEEKARQVEKRILRSATALFKACKKSYEENRCKGCPFNVIHGCSLYSHPIEWESLLKSVKIKK